MQRFYQLMFIVSLLALSWFTMMAVHELGHVVGAFLSGGHVERVVLHPVTISRTDVSPNPSPAIVVWLGPIVGCILPLVGLLLLPRYLVSARNVAMFFAGFCLIANGAYIALGSFDNVGDSGVMLQNGSPLWLLLAFGSITIPLGLYCWHRLGSVQKFLDNSSNVDAKKAYTAFLVLVILLTAEVAFSPR